MPLPFDLEFDFRLERRGPYPHKGLKDPTNGDTPIIEQPIRMVSIDTPEKKYGGGQVLGQRKLDACRERLETGFYNSLIPTATSKGTCSFIEAKI